MNVRRPDAQQRTLSISTESGTKLKYLPKHRVLLCTTCDYCVLPSALGRHLKVIHHLPAAERRACTSEISDLDLAELGDVCAPAPSSAPVRGLPILDGLACGEDDCYHYCVTRKRMEAHWRTQHSSADSGARLDHKKCRPVKLQTFFRGSNLQYFEVSISARTDNELDQEGLPGSRLKEPLPNDSNDSSAEWSLIKHFEEEAHASLIPAKCTAQASWRDLSLQAGEHADYLRYALLSLTAHHVAFRHSESRELYSEEADKYRNLAISTLREQVTEVDVTRFFEVFNFTRLLNICCLAGIQLSKLRGRYDYSATTKGVLPEWIPMQLEGRKLIWSLRGEGRIVNALQAPAQDLFAAFRMPAEDLPFNPHDGYLSALDSALRSLQHPSITQVSLEALHTLRRVWAVPYRHPANGFRDVALMWAVRVPVDFLHLIAAHDPVALVVFAHYCVLWTFAEREYWYMRGHAETMLFRVVQRLEWKWQLWIVWPIRMVFGEMLARGRGERKRITQQQQQQQPGARCRGMGAGGDETEDEEALAPRVEEIRNLVLPSIEHVLAETMDGG